jgi:hypothetical protein
MRYCALLSSLILCATMLGAAPVDAQTPMALDAAPLPFAPRDTAGADDASVWNERLGKTWGIDLMLGLPAGVRLFCELGAPTHWLPEVEAFAGLYIIVPMVGGGLRWQCTPLCGECNALVVRPGFDGYVLENPFYGSEGWFGGGPHYQGMAATDVDLVWQHWFDRHWSGEIGLKVGAGAIFSANRTRELLVPIGGLFMGFRY